jgi:hypothetical protein
MLSVTLRANTPTDWDRNIHAGSPRHPFQVYTDRLKPGSLASDLCQLASRVRRTLVSTVAEPSIPAEARPDLQLCPLPWADPEPPEQADALSVFYVERHSDTAALRAIQGQGVTLTIKGPCQVGKTSLLMRVALAARQCGKRVVALDLQALDPCALRDGRQFFQTVCDVASFQLGIEPCADAFWGQLGDSYTCTRYFEQHLLRQAGAPLVLAFDKIDRIANAALHADLFAMLRAWGTNRATHTLWGDLDLVLTTSTDPRHLIQSPYQSPFNSTETVVLDDFTPAQVGELNERHGRPFDGAQQRALVALLGGHPYLIRRALYLVASGQFTAAALLAHADEDDGPFGEHLRYHLFKLHNQPQQIAGLRQVIRAGECADEQAYHGLHSAGLVRRERERAVARCHV